jgi:hypothetical protein
MSNTSIQLKKSGQTGNTPSNLAFGEIAINYADGKLYYKDDTGSIDFISNQSSFDTINANNSLILATGVSDTLSFVAGNNISINTNTTTKTITINSTAGNDAYARDTANAAFQKANNALANTNGATFGGDLNVTGKLSVIASSGDEGGEIFLAQAQSNTTLSGGITIDSYQNKIRFFEQGGSARGAYIDLTECVGGAGTNLLNPGATPDSTARATANAAFLQANAAYSSQNTTGTYANSAYNQANTATTNAATADSKAVTAGSYANSAFLVANTADDKAITAGSYANSAFNQANTATNNAAGSSLYANAAFVHANAAFNAANTAGGGSGNAAFIFSGTSNVYFATANGNIVANVGGNTIATVTNTGIQIAGGDLAGANNIYANNFISNNTITISGSGGDISGANNITGNNIIAANGIVAAGLNVVPHLQSAFTAANTPSHVANSAAIYANGAFTKANTDVTDINITSGTFGNSTHIPVVTVSANGRINTISTVAATGGGGGSGNASFISSGTSNVYFTSANGSILANVDGNTIATVTNTGILMSGAEGDLSGANNVYANTFIANTRIRVAGTGGDISGANNITANTFTVNNTIVISGSGGDISGASNITGNNIIAANGVTVAGLNVVPHLQSAFLVANTPSHVANSAALYANGAFIQANTATNNAAGASLYANGAFIQANTATNNAAGASLYANAAFAHANAAFNAANTGGGGGSGNASFIFSGTSNVFFATANGNIVANVGGNTIATVTNTGIQMAGSEGDLSGANNVYANTFIANTKITIGTGIGGNIFGANNIYANTFIANTRIRVDGTGGDISGANNITGNNIIAANGIVAAGLNVVTHLQSAFTAANTPSHVANSAALYANAAFLAANTPSHVANSAAIYANGAFIQANTATNNSAGASLYANGAFIQANTATNNAAGASLYANGAFIQANTATNNAAGASLYANGAFIQANAAYTRANNSLNANTGGTVTGNVTVTGFTNLGNVGNVIITGGVANHVLRTDGAGNLSWVAQTGGGGGTTDQFARDTANAAFTQANSAFTQANTGGSFTSLTVDKFTGDGSTTSFTLSTIPSNENDTIVNIEGVLQLHSSYNVSNSIITFDGAPANGVTVEVITLGIRSASGITTDNFVGNGNTNVFTLSTTPPNKNSTTVNYNGVILLRSDYSISGANLILDSAPANGASIEVTTLGDVSVSSSISSARSLGYSLIFGG